MKVNWNTVATTLTGLAIVAFIGGVWDFQNIKAKVSSLEDSDDKKSKTLKAIGVIVCSYAIKDKMKNAEEICKEVLSN